MPVSIAFARILAAGRTQFNAVALEARHTLPGFDTDVFAAFLVSGVDPVVAAVADVVPERAALVAVAAYDIAAVLVARGVVGPAARSGLVTRVWTELAPRLPEQVSDAPAEVLGALSNAAIYLENRGLRGDEWMDHMLALSKLAQGVTPLLRLGQVLAWRAGAAHLREGALRAIEELPDHLALAAVGADAGAPWSEVRQRLRADPWWSPARAQGLAPRYREVGAFSGFGGIFQEPPQVRAGEAGFWVKSGSRYSLLLADLFGAILAPATAEEFGHAPTSDSGPPPARLLAAMGGDLPTEGLTMVRNAHSAAVVSPYTHTIRVFPLS